MAMWLLDTFPNSIHVPNNNSDQVVHFAAAEGKHHHRIMLCFNVCTVRTHISLNYFYLYNWNSAA